MKNKDKTKSQLLKELAKLRQRIVELEKPETKIKKAKAKIETNKDRKQTEDRLSKELAAIAAVVNDMLRREVDDAQTEERVMDACLVATDSVYGMTGVINEHGKYNTTTYSSQTLQDCAFPESLAWKLPTGMTIRGIWGWPMLHGKPLLCNDLKAHPDRVGFPQGHVRLRCFLGVPLKSGRKVVGMLAVANKPGGYTQEDMDTLIRLASVMSMSQQYRLALKAAKRASAELEQLVAERTKQVREREDSLASAQRIARMGNWDWDIINNKLQWSDEIYRIFGLKPQEFDATYEAFLNAVHPDDREFVKKSINNALYKRKPYSIDHSIVLPDGSERIVHEQAEVLFNETGRAIRMAGTVQDITERKRAEEHVIQIQEYLQLQIDRMPNGLIVWDTDFRVQTWNPAAEKIFGFTKEETQGKHPYGLIVPKEAQPHVDKIWRRLLEGDKTAHSTNENITKDGRTIICDWSNTPLKRADGTVIGVLSTVQDTTERKKAEEKTKASLKEKEALLQEVHHRVKNNMQLISSLFSLQSRHIKDRQALEIFKSSQNRVRSMAVIHERLYQSKDFARVDFVEYVQSLTRHLLSSYAINPDVIKLNIDIKDVFLDINTAIPSGLIINELVTNSLKHAFPDDKKGEIKIAMHPLYKNDMELTVSDNGVGIPEEVNFRNTETLGLHLVTILAEDQLHGDIRLKRTRGTSFSIRFRMKR